MLRGSQEEPEPAFRRRSHPIRLPLPRRVQEQRIQRPRRLRHQREEDGHKKGSRGTAGWKITSGFLSQFTGWLVDPILVAAPCVVI